VIPGVFFLFVLTPHDELAEEGISSIWVIDQFLWASLSIIRRGSSQSSDRNCAASIPALRFAPAQSRLDCVGRIVCRNIAPIIRIKTQGRFD